jgi:toxin ParE1/3/4
MVEIVILPRAQRDIRIARRWYNERREGLGDELVDEIHSKLEAVSKTPLMHAVYAQDARRTTLNRFPYSILYLVVDDRLLVVAVGHDKQNWRNIIAERLDS